MKRDIFAELVEGFDALAGERAGKVNLRSHKVELNKLAAVTADELVDIRERWPSLSAAQRGRLQERQRRTDDEK